MKNKRILTESTSAIESGIAKSLCGAPLMPSELDELHHMTYADLMTEHDLDSLMAEKVITHIRHEVQRLTGQSLQTWAIDSRDNKGSYTRTHPMRESRNPLVELDAGLEDITDMSTLEKHPPNEAGRMLDYGHSKSDSGEGRMMRQALHEISEYSKELHEILNDDDDLPQWCHYKVAVARACVGKVKHYLEYKIKHPKQK